MSPPGQMNPKVSQMFGRYRQVWEDALARWIPACQGVEKERKTLRATGGLVADATRRTHWRPDAAISDALPAGPTGLTPEAAERLDVLDRRSAKCESTIHQMQLIISDLKHAEKYGVWNNRQQLWVGVRAKPDFLGKSLGRISRDEKMDVLDVKGEWWRVRTSGGVEGWMHRGHIAPVLPVELNSKAGKLEWDSSGATDPHSSESTSRG